MRLLARLLCAALLTVALLPAGARADADPPSDILLLQDVYFPFEPKVSKKLEKELNGVTEKANKAGFKIKVALIAARLDLGGVPGYFGKPEPYVKFLYSEITQPTGKQTLLAVMPGGIGIVNPPKGGEDAIDDLKVPKNAKSDQLATTAIEAVRRLARAAGHPIGGGGGGFGSVGGASPLLVFGLPVLLVAAAALVIRLRSREEDEDEEDEAPDEEAEPSVAVADDESAASKPGD